jgi:starch phosphorylase
MNILYVIHRYLTIKAMTPEQRKKVVARVVMFGGKAAPGYINAKRIIKLVNEVAEVVNNDHTTRNLLKVIFLPNYNVSNAEIIIPASDISQHVCIS